MNIASLSLYKHTHTQVKHWNKIYKFNIPVPNSAEIATSYDLLMM